MKKRKTYEISIVDKTYSKIISDETKFYTSDTALELVFKLKETEYTFESAEIVLLNVDDRSKVTRPVTKVNNDFVYEIEDDIIAHYGEWLGQLRFEQAEETYVSSPVKFRIENDLGNERPPQLSDVQSWVSLKRYADSLTDELKQAVLSVEGVEDTFNENETVRQNRFSNSEQSRQTTFETNESERDETFNTNESARQTQELEREIAENQRQTVFDNNETNRNETFSANEAIRQKNEDARIEAEQQREGTLDERFYSLESGREPVEVGDNLFQNETLRDGGYWNEFGTWVSSSQYYSVEGFINIEQGETYSNNFYNARLYDINDNIVGSVSNAQANIKITDGVTVKIRPTYRKGDAVIQEAFVYKIGYKNNKLVVDVNNLDSEIKNKLESVSQVGNSKIEPFETEKFMHFSCDDFITPLQDIYVNASTYTSIFDNASFDFLKRTHDRYGICFSAYLYYQNADNSFNLSMMPDKFKEEFKENAHWLKFGYHGESPATNLASTTGEVAKAEYNKMIAEIVRFTGTYKTIDRMPRLQNYAGNLESVQALKNANAGIVGLLSAEDTRYSYYHTAEQRDRLLNYDRFYDSENKLMFMGTDIRLDNDSGFDTLELRKTDPAYKNRMNDVILFLHDPNIANSTRQNRITLCCDFALRNGYRFDFPMNVVIR